VDNIMAYVERFSYEDPSKNNPYFSIPVLYIK
jgi:hypothetical protein